ncbi:MAG: hypothetical protein KIC92_08190 [Clostridiales bacterium]|nr:hypothetical protein [Clostridiales bacterium]
MYKTYLVRLVKGVETYLLARNNKEAMKLTGRATKWYGDVLKVIDNNGSEVINNEKIFTKNI